MKHAGHDLISAYNLFSDTYKVFKCSNCKYVLWFHISNRTWDMTAISGEIIDLLTCDEITIKNILE